MKFGFGARRPVPATATEGPLSVQLRDLPGKHTNTQQAPEADTTTNPEASKSGTGDLQHLHEMTFRSA